MRAPRSEQDCQPYIPRPQLPTNTMIFLPRSNFPSLYVDAELDNDGRFELPADLV
jgi:hypothetical protein